MSSFELEEYKKLLADIKVQVRFAQQKAMISANAAMIQMYWQIGLLVDKRQKEEGWGAAIIPRLAADLKNDYSNQQGFSARNLNPRDITIEELNYGNDSPSEWRQPKDRKDYKCSEVSYYWEKWLRKE